MYNNYARRTLKHFARWLYYPLYLVYYCYLISEVKAVSEFGYRFCVLMTLCLVVGVTVCNRVLEGCRKNIIGPFTTPFTFDYSFGTFHILKDNINGLIKQYVG